MQRFHNILLIVDEGTDYSAALRRAIKLTKSNQAQLTICTVVDVVPSEIQVGITAVTPTELQDIVISDKRVWLEEVVESVAHEGLSIKANVLVGRPFIEIIRHVLGNGHDLIIKCAAVAGGLRDLLFGSADMHLMRKCPCPVWIINPTERQRYRRILAAVDRDPEVPVEDALNRQIIELSTSLAQAECSEIHVVHVWKMIGEDFFRSPRSGVSGSDVDALVAEEAGQRKSWLRDLVKNCGPNSEMVASEPLEPLLHVVKGQAAELVAAKARELAVDLVVMGTVAHTGIAGFFMGDTAEAIISQLDCSVIAVKPPGFISPVSLEAI